MGASRQDTHLCCHRELAGQQVRTGSVLGLCICWLRLPVVCWQCTSSPLFQSQSIKQLACSHFSLLCSCSYNVILRHDLLANDMDLAALSREESALVRPSHKCFHFSLLNAFSSPPCSCWLICALLQAPSSMISAEYIFIFWFRSLQIDYYLSLNSQQFVGNSVSTFSAMLIMERWNAGRYASYYNGGNIPLEVFLPLYK